MTWEVSPGSRRALESEAGKGRTPVHCVSEQVAAVAPGAHS